MNNNETKPSPPTSAKYILTLPITSKNNFSPYIWINRLNFVRRLDKTSYIEESKIEQYESTCYIMTNPLSKDLFPKNLIGDDDFIKLKQNIEIDEHFVSILSTINHHLLEKFISNRGEKKLSRSVEESLRDEGIPQWVLKLKGCLFTLTLHLT